MNATRICPACRVAVSATAIVDAFNDPAAWSFWGEPGARFIRCRGEGYVHFIVTINGRSQHRLAIIRLQPEGE